MCLLIPPFKFPFHFKKYKKSKKNRNYSTKAATQTATRSINNKNMAAKKVLDWNKVKAVLAKEDFSIVNEHRARGLELSRVLAATVPKVDLSHYKSVLENQKLVADIEAELKTFKPARADPAPILKSLKDQRVAAVPLSLSLISY
jgi:hypothetical protein